MRDRRGLRYVCPGIQYLRRAGFCSAKCSVVFLFNIILDAQFTLPSCRRLFFVYWKLMETFLVNKMFTGTSLIFIQGLVCGGLLEHEFDDHICILLKDLPSKSQ
jgi:hypothetical protein